MLKEFRPRLYQETILATAVKKNTLVVLPTGMGKTAIAMMLAAYRLKQFPESKILILACTKPLVDQHYETFRKFLNFDESRFAMFTGNVSPEKRADLWKDAKVIFSTPQGLENDIISGKIGLEDVSLLVVDEAHRAVGDYSYVFIAKQYNKKARFPKILALTASPGSDLEKINEIIKNLYIEEIEIRTDESPDVRPYIKEIDVEWVKVELPDEFKEVKKYLDDCYKSKLKAIKDLGYLNSAAGHSKKELLEIQGALHAQISQGDKSFDILKSVSLMAEAMKVHHAVELIETQGITALVSYLNDIESQAENTKVRAVKNLLNDINFRSAIVKAKKLYEAGIEHPKFDKLKDIVSNEIKNKDVKVIVFTQYRDSALKIISELNKIENANAKIFVGQLKKKESGLSQKEQKRILDEFRAGGFNVLISTSVGEEGLDVPAVDLVVFYEPIPSAIRHIQRRGRTGRQEKGRVIILMAKDTRDEAYRWSAHHKEKKMHRHLDNLKSKIVLSNSGNKLDKYVPEEERLKIFADYREKGSGIIKELAESNVIVSLERLDTADYVVSSRCGIEVKTVEDFVNSIIDGRLLDQIKELKRNFERPLIIIEGIEDIYSVRRVHPNAIRGMLATIAISYGIPILNTKNSQESAALLRIIAKREQEYDSGEFSMHTRKPLSLKDLQEYVVSSLPDVGGAIAKNLLEKFGSVKNVFNANEEELKEVELIGEKKAKRIREVVDGEYDKDKNKI